MQITLNAWPESAGAADAAEEIQTLRRKLEQFRLLVENSLDMVVQVTLQGQIIYISPNVKMVLGYEPEELTGVSIFEHVHPENLAEVVEKFALPEAQVTCRYRHKDGSWRWLETSGRDYLGSDGEMHGALIARDITARKKSEEENARLEAQLRQAQKLEALGTLAGGVAHDFSNIVGAILAYTDLALIETSDQPSVQRYLGQVHAAGERAKDLVQQILSFRRQKKHERKPVRVQLIAMEVLNLLMPMIQKGIELVADLSPATSPVLACPSQLHQVLLNLCTNAVQAMGEGPGRLDVRLLPFVVSEEFSKRLPNLRPGPHVRLSITDTGHGMDAETVGRIFDPFFTTKGAVKGTGLGLRW